MIAVIEAATIVVIKLIRISKYSHGLPGPKDGLLIQS